MKRGDTPTRRQITGQIHLKPEGATEWFSVGQVRTIKLAADIKRTPVVIARKGYHQKQQDLMQEVAWEYEAKLDEHFDELIKLIMLGVKGSDEVQVENQNNELNFAQAPEDPWLQGRSYFVGKYNLSEFNWTGDGDEPVEGVDYEIDLGSGMFTALSDFFEQAAQTENSIEFAYNVHAVTFETYTSQSANYTRGEVRIDEFDQHSEVPIAKHEFTAQFYVTDRGDNDGTKINEFVLKMLAQTKPEITTRGLRIPLPPSDVVAQQAADSLDVEITWTDNSDNETGFLVEWKEDVETEWLPVGQVGPGVTTITHTASSIDINLTYRVTALGAVGNSPAVESAEITIIEPV